MAKDVDSRAQHAIELVSEKTKEADQHASDASNKSELAQQTANTVNTRLPKVETIVGGLDQYKGGTQTVIQYRPGQTALSKDAKQSLDEMASQLKDQHGYVVEVHGYSSGSGQAALASSRRMADSVVRYLVLNHEIPAYRIYVMGMGNAPASAEEGKTGKRSSRNRVEVSVLKNSVDQLASTTSSGASAPPK
jgi:outer membrane protein OmpA-like peptidoglycan-associated protein